MELMMQFISENKDKLKPFGFFALTLVGLYGINKVLSDDTEEFQELEDGASGRNPVGILNQGNTCFVNSLLQALSSVKTFNQTIKQLLQYSCTDDDNEQLFQELNNVIKKINSSSGPNRGQSIRVMPFLEILAKIQADLINFEQQDAHQLYSSIVRCFDDFFNKRKQQDLAFSRNSLHKSLSFFKIDKEKQEKQKKQPQLQQLNQDIYEQPINQLQNPLIGYTKSTIQCMTCRNTTTIKIHSFYDLSLQIQPQFVRDLNSALKWFQRVQKIQKYACTHCSIQAHLRRLQIAKGKIQGQHSEQLSKVNQKLINFLTASKFEDMDLNDINKQLERQVIQHQDLFHLIGDNPLRNEIFSHIRAVQRDIIKQTKITKYPKILVIHLKQLIINPYSGEPVYIRKPIDYETIFKIDLKSRIKTYKLTSLLTHVGNQMMGHYFTFRKQSRFDEEWFLISDSHTEKCSEFKMRRHVPYMFFYELDSEESKFKNQQLLKK